MLVEIGTKTWIRIITNSYLGSRYYRCDKYLAMAQSRRSGWERAVVLVRPYSKLVFTAKSFKDFIDFSLSIG